MKIISWNCNCSFRTKYKHILEENADIYVIQECENPEKYGDKEFKSLFNNGFWSGELDFKGLGIFSTNPNLKLTKLNWPGNKRKYFIPVSINDDLTVIAVWACKPYCEMFYDYFQDIKYNLEQSKKLLMIGDFNSSVVLDGPHKKEKTWGHCVELLNQIGYEDVYNTLNNEEEGKESCPTFFEYRHLDKPYHFDRCITNKGLITKETILTNYKWITRSDHLPIFVEF